MEQFVVKVAEVYQLEVDKIHESAKEDQSCGRLIHRNQHQVDRYLCVSKGA